MIPESQRCRHCGIRYQQGEGLCRRCWRDLNDQILAGRARAERDRAARLMADRAQAGPVERREIHVEGRDFVVMWDGSGGT